MTAIKNNRQFPQIWYTIGLSKLLSKLVAYQKVSFLLFSMNDQCKVVLNN